MFFSKAARLDKLAHEMFQASLGMDFFTGSTVTSAKAKDGSFVRVVTEKPGERSAALLGKAGLLELRYDANKKDASLTLVFDYPQGSKEANCIDATLSSLEGEGAAGSVEEYIHSIELCYIEEDNTAELVLSMNKVKLGKAMTALRFLIKKASVYLVSLEKIFAEL